MLKLKKLQVLGFKSFCDRTELKFHGDGIAAIVGPNGCGKSNIADAIAWVLGEQSAKSLRGTRMEDVIFIGTRDRKPTGMAEVSLTFVDPDVYEGPIPLETEIDVKDEGDDWDEATIRAESAAETERSIEEVQPLGAEEVVAEGAEPTAAADPGDTEAPAAASTDGKHVVLKIRRRKFKPQQFAVGEIVITRRLFRSGESEYLLNGKICRLRDIQDLFMGTGLGPESYAIIEQGRIGQILSSKPHDRRAIIEEAAGVTKFKARKRLAELRLEQSTLNLARINDIFEEVTRQMNSLKRQASKAERYAKLRDELKAKLRVVLASRFAALEQERDRLRDEITAVSAEMQSGSEQVQQAETEHAQGTERGYQLDAEARDAAERSNAIALELDRASARRRHNEERIAELKARAASQNLELGRTREQHHALAQELEANQTLVAGAAERVQAAASELAARQADLQRLTEAITALEREQETRREQIMTAASAGAQVRNQIAKSEEQTAALDREAARLRGEMQGASAQIEACGGQRGQAAFEFESVSEAVAQVIQQIASARSAIELKRSAETEAKLRLDGLRAEYATALGRKSSLESLIAEHGYSTESVKRLFQSGIAKTNFSPAGVLADFLEVEDQYEAVVEDFLRDELNYVVVKSWDAADEGLRLLRSNVDGRATFLVHPEDAQARFSFKFDESTGPARRRESVLPLKNCIRVLNGFGKSLEVILPKLGNGYIAPDAATARDMALENPSAFFLAPSGETFHNVTVTGGKQRSEGPLSMKRELREVMRNLQDLQRALGEQEATAALLGREIAELTKAVEKFEEAKRQAETRLMTSSHALQHLDSELQRVRERLAAWELESARLQSELRELQQALAQQRQSEQTHESLRQELETEFTAGQAGVQAARHARDGAAESSASAAAQLATVEAQRQAAAAALERIESMAKEMATRVAALEQQIAAEAAESAQRHAENIQISGELQSLELEQAARRQRREEINGETEALRANLQQLEQQLRELRHQLDQLRDRRGELSATSAKLESDATYLGESCLNELGITREDLLADISIPRLTGDLLAAEDAMQRDLRSRLESMGPVNMMALEEYNEVSQRHAFLETQRKDLLESIENTKASIRELDEVTRAKFEEAFNRINENFQFTFRKLFAGGQAFMRLTDQENSTESGIDVIASPPGKKLQNVLLLSGGEKALTALALLVAIFQYQPSPFCLLDEVDAPLDEANVGRFTDMVRELSGTTQFILITHNKRTMSVAPVMYGVTMQEPGVSKIVSVRFGEQQAASA